MIRTILTHLRRLHLDERGNVFILFAATAIPLLLVMGGAVDVSRYSRYKVELSNAVDAAALALARQGPTFTEAQAETFIASHVNAFVAADNQFSVPTFDVVKLPNGFLITANGAMETMFLPLGGLAHDGQGIGSMAVNITAEVVNSSNRVELALVMDNTGSMNCAATLSTCVSNWSSPAADSRIKSVKTAAKALIDTLMPDGLDDPNFIKIAIVPFEGQVNVASAGFSVTSPPSWIDWADAAASSWHGLNFNKRHTSTGVTCTGTASTCKYVGHKWLFNQLTSKFPTVKWAGCVEMRAGTYELTDAAPTSTADTKFVPFFHPDEPDSPTTAGSSGATRYDYDSNGSSSGGTQYTYQNDYLNDKAAAAPATSQKSFDKYKFTTTAAAYPAFWFGRMDVEGLNSPYEYGPNKGCPRPIYPLANANYKTALKTQIDSMIAYWSTGTFLPTGLVWGWHVLSPGIPYTEGIAPSAQYDDKTVKAIVFFTDGENDVTDDANLNASRYNGYSYVGTVNASSAHRLSTTAAGAITALNTKTATLCANVKTNGTLGAGPNTQPDDIRLYVITFGTISSTASTLMTNCATLDSTGNRLYYHAPTTSALADIFHQIGQDLSDIHLAR